jgi:diaminohydroxyphosphoribosylaminopyrimidine deaminase/5-amino-6-(5-phosphoribosylamino)uracil reductase
MFTPLDQSFMRRALDLAGRGLYTTTPNPRVGAVVVKEGRTVGEGFHQVAGESHAEVNAIRDAKARHGADAVRDATVYVTLEPCSHQGRTGPCCEALIHAGLARVVVAEEDPNPQVAGQGIARLRAAGIQVEVGLLSAQAHELNIGFFKRMTHGTPWVRMKIAASLDGQTALENGVSQWITSAHARDDGHAWRARACAVLTGIGTVLEDDPQLDVRAVPTPRQPTLVVMDSQLETPPTAQLFKPQRPV